MTSKVHPCMPWTIFRGSSTATTAAAPGSVLSGSAAPSASDLCGALTNAIGSTSQSQVGGKPCRHDASEAVQRSLAAIIQRLHQAASPGPSSPSHGHDRRREGSELVAALLSADLPAKLVAQLDYLGFETRKDAMRLFSLLLRSALPLGADPPLVDYLRDHPRILHHLLDGSGRPEIFAHCAQMLRCCTRYPQLVSALLQEGAAARLIALARYQCFDISSEAFSSLRELLLAHRHVAAAYVSTHFEDFFEGFHTLLSSDMGYVARRQALRLLGDVLLDRPFMEVMLAYVSNERFLQIHMNLLRDSSKSIQLDAFHVFKIFVANPNKPSKVILILHKNRDRLVKLLTSLSEKREGNTSFDEDLKAVTGVLQVLELRQRSLRVSVPANPNQEFADEACDVVAAA